MNGVTWAHEGLRNFGRNGSTYMRSGRCGNIYGNGLGSLPNTSIVCLEQSCVGLGLELFLREDNESILTIIAIGIYEETFFIYAE